VEYQLIPPYFHRGNATERAIRTFKEHFVTGTASSYTDLPLHLWDILLPQSEMTLNLLRTSTHHPQLFSASHYHGMIDYNNMILLPQDAISLHMKNSINGGLGHLMENMATPWGL
jgi:hypothetical protein